MPRVTIVIILLFFTLGCSWASRVSYKGRASLGIMKENLVSDDLSSLEDAGIVIGRVARENETGDFSDYVDRKVIFENLKTGQELSYYDGDYFFMRLPEGQYEIKGFETRRGMPLRSVRGGFKFTVKNGEIIYIGNIIGEKGLKKRLRSQTSDGVYPYSVPKSFVAGSYEGGASLFTPQANGEYTFYVVDDKASLVEKFNCLFPNLKDIEIKTDLMNY